MKTPNKSNLLMAVLAVLFVLAGVSQSSAYYDRYPNGYWDRNGHWQNYGYHNHHRGYWDNRSNGRIWINIG